MSGKTLAPGLVNWASVCRRTGATQRQLHYWMRVGLVWPSQPAQGQGTRIGFAEDEVEWIAVLVLASDVGLAPGSVGAQCGDVGAHGYAERLRALAHAVEKSCPDWLDGPNPMRVSFA